MDTTSGKNTEAMEMKGVRKEERTFYEFIVEGFPYRKSKE